MDFYGQLLGWTFTQFGDMPYWAIDTGEGAIGMNSPGMGINGGLTQRQGPAPERGGPVNGCTVVVGVDGSIDELFQKGLDLGAAEGLPLADLQAAGRGGYLLDPGGHIFGFISATLSDGSVAMGGGGAVRSPRERRVALPPPAGLCAAN